MYPKRTKSNFLSVLYDLRQFQISDANVHKSMLDKYFVQKVTFELLVAAKLYSAANN